MVINRINVNNNNANLVEKIVNSLEHTFRRIDTTQACVIADFPKISNSPIDFFIWLRIPFGQGGYRAGTAKEYKDRLYLNNLAFTIRIIEIPNLSSIKGSTIFKVTHNNELAELDLLSERNNDEHEIERFIKERVGLRYFYCPEIIWLKGYKSTDISISERPSMIVFDDTIFKMEHVINQVADNIVAKSKFQRGFYSFPDKDQEDNEYDMNVIINNIIDAANEGSRYGILTKKKLEAITRLVRNTERIIEAQKERGKICIITGKAGTGKTLALSRAIYQIAQSGHHARFLTYNRLLAIDMKQTLRALSIKVSNEKNKRLDSANVTCSTIHEFFHDLTQKLNVLDYISEERVVELQNVCKYRIDLAKQFLSKYNFQYGEEFHSKLDSILEDVDKDTNIDKLDHKEIRRCIDSVITSIKWKYSNNASQIDISKIIGEELETYEKQRLDFLYTYALKDVFKSDYFKVLEILYAKIVQPREFLYRQRTMSRNDFLKWVAKVNPNATDQDIYNQELNEEEFKEVKEQIDSAKRKINWSNTIFIDEGQDCNLYEKLILQHLKGNENLVVATGGPDQLIRTPKTADWSKTFGGASLDPERISLGRQTHRQKSNIVNFANEFAKINNFSLEMEIDSELEGVGNIIIDTRKSGESEIPMDITSELKNNGACLGYSQYESMLFLLPIKGKYVSRHSNGFSIHIDENDNMTEEEDFAGQKVCTTVEDIKIWSGVGESKSKSPFPQQNQSRFIYYESCRGLEACNVLCIDLDVFYNFKKVSKEADKYVNQNIELFLNKDELRKQFATIWCTMIFTRAIDTLYIKLNDPHCEFSQSIIETAKKFPGTRILQ